MVSIKSSPAEDFLRGYDIVDHQSLFRDYSRFLLEVSDIKVLPIDLDRIRQRFGLQRREAHLEQRGFLLAKTIFVNSDDIDTVKRFTEAHELMELLVLALESHLRYKVSHLVKKEQLCEYGAAELLMPTHLIKPVISKVGYGLSGAKQLANCCETSLSAAMRKILTLDYSPQIFTLLKENFKKSQVVPSLTGQGVLWGEPEDWNPEPELRVWKRWSSPQTKPYLCINESFSRNTLAYSLLKNGEPGVIESRRDFLDLKFIKGEYFVEGMKVNINKIPSVMLLLHL